MTARSFRSCKGIKTRMAKISIDRTYLVADKLGPAGAVNTTLQRRLWMYLDWIEARYGHRDMRWTIMGVEYHPDGGHLACQGDHRVMVRLPLDTMDDPIETHHFLAHEAVHLLSPDPVNQATVLEEGVCEMFAVDIVREEHRTKIKTQLDRYARAETLVRKLVAMNPEVIRRLREIEPSFRKMQPLHLRAVVPTIDNQFLAELLEPLWKKGEFEEWLAERERYFAARGKPSP